MMSERTPSAAEPVVRPAGAPLAGGYFASVPFDPARGVDVPVGATPDGVHHDEWALAASFSPARRAAFVAGRQALRAALKQLSADLAASPVLHTPRGAPRLPDAYAGSISHKRTRAIAVAAPSAHGTVGVDLEERPRERDVGRPSIAGHILTDAERDVLEGLDALAHREATLVRFALKEAVYKAIDPFVQRYVRFTEVELDVHEHGDATVRLLLPELTNDDMIVQASWHLDDGFIIATARGVRSAR